MEGNIAKRLQQSRVDVIGEIKKDSQGYGYNYFSNDNILPIANEVFNRNGICPIFTIEEKESLNQVVKNGDTTTETYNNSFWGHLILHNIDDFNDFVDFYLPTCLAQVKGASAVQNYGGMVTFAKRYAYLVALEIADGSDREIEKSTDNERKAEEKSSSKKVAKITDKQIELIKSKASEEDIKAILGMYKVSAIEEMDIQMASDCLKRLS